MKLHLMAIWRRIFAKLRRLSVKRKRDFLKKTAEGCGRVGWTCLQLVCMFAIWGLVCMRHRPRTPEPLPEHLSWMESQRDMRRYLLPDDGSRRLLPAAPCDGRVFAVLVVCSAAPNFDARQAIRDTWGKDAARLSHMRVFFLLGKSSNETLNSAIYNESRRSSDIIQESFLDTYNNLTLKSVMLLQWIGQNCRNAQYVMKTDDDTFVNVPNLFRLLKVTGRKGLLIGRLFRGTVPEKDKNSDWFVPEVVYQGHVYPPYLSGMGYVMSRDVASVLYQTALNTAFFYLEDIFITGICSSRAGIKPANNEGFVYQKRQNNTCASETLIAVHRMKPYELIQLWKNLHNSSMMRFPSYT